MEKKATFKKNSCHDCDFCQCCSDTRCRLCRQSGRKKCGKDAGPGKKIHKPLFRAY